jgi:hypothetical protein
MQRSAPVMFVADFFHPGDRLAVQCLLNGDMRHCGRRCTLGLRHSGLVICPWTATAQKLLLETSRRRSRTTTRLGSCAGRQPASAQSPAFAERGAIADLDRHAEAFLIHLHPEWIRFVEIERIIFGIVRSEDGSRFTRGEHMASHVALRTHMLPRSQYFLEGLPPIPHRLAIDPYNDMPDNRRSDPFVSEGKVDVGRIAAVEFEDGPHSGTHLLALHVGGVTRNTQSQESNKGRNDCVVSARAARCPVFRHEADLIVACGFMSIAPIVANPLSGFRFSRITLNFVSNPPLP